jgi:hypothetical protein
VSIVVDILLLQTISIAIASAGVFVAAVYYILQIRHQTKLRQTDMVMRLYDKFGSTEFLKAYQTIMGAEFEDYEDYLKRYSTYAEVRLALMSMGTYFEGIGMLVKRKLVGMDLIDDLLNANILSTWEKMKPVAEGMRKRVPQSWEWFEYLYNEMKKREQRGVKSG